MTKFVCKGYVEFEIIADEDCSLKEAVESTKVFGVCQSEKCNIINWEVTDVEEVEIKR